MRLSRAALALLLMPLALPAWSATYYVAAKGAATSGTSDGSKARPYKTPDAALSKAKGGDTILLMDGSYGDLIVNNRSYTSPVTIRSMNGKKARANRISVEGKSSNLVVQNISVWPGNSDADRNDRVRAGSSSKDVVFDGLDVRSDANAGSYATWSKSKWAARNMKGINSTGTRVTVKNSTFTGLGFSAVLSGASNKALNNTIQGFSMDAVRVLGDNSVIQGNRIVDAVRVNGNHPDAIQSWSRNGKPVKGLVIADNTIIEWASKQKSPLSARVQGIGFFDGFFDDITVRGNTIAVTSYHGISIYGARRGSVTGNTVLNGKGQTSTYPWIGIYSHKNGKPSTDVKVTGNQAMKFTGKTNTGNRVVYSGNSVIKDPSSQLTDLLGTSVATAKSVAKSASLAVLDLDAPQPGMAFATFALADEAAPGMAGLAAIEPAAVPLPAAGWLMLAGIGGLGALARRRRAA